MMESMRGVVELGQALSVDERNLLSVACKNVIGSRRSSWRVLSSLQHREEERQRENSEKRIECIKTYRQQVEKELQNICDDVLSIIDKHLLKDVADDEAKVFYLKMKGDYHRYGAEFATDKTRSDASLTAYEEALKHAQSLPATQPIRLGLALNFSVFYYEILGQTDKACELAKSAFDEAMEKLDEVKDTDHYKDSTLIMQLLRDNLTLWQANEDDRDNQAPAENAQADNSNENAAE